MSQIIRYLVNMLPYMLISLPFFITFRVVIYVLRKDESKQFNLVRECMLMIFVLYLVGLASQTIFPKIEFGNGGISIVGAFQHRYNLIPFSVFIETYQAVFIDHCFNYFIINFLGNIIIFIPIGFFIPLLWHKMRSLGKTVLCGFIISLFIELIQFPLYRGTDIDDLWLNTLGVLVGYFVLILSKKIIPRSLAQPCANLLMDRSE